MGNETQTIFFVLLESSTGKTYRMKRFNNKKTLDDLFDWVHEQRRFIKEKTNQEYIVLDFKMINSPNEKGWNNE